MKKSIVLGLSILLFVALAGAGIGFALHAFRNKASSEVDASTSSSPDSGVQSPSEVSPLPGFAGDSADGESEPEDYDDSNPDLDSSPSDEEAFMEEEAREESRDPWENVKCENETTDILKNGNFKLVFTKSVYPQFDPPCQGNGAELYSDKKELLGTFSRYAKVTPDQNYIYDVSGSQTECGRLLDGRVAIYDLKLKNLVLDETFVRSATPMAGSVFELLQANGIEGFYDAVGQTESVKITPEGDGRFLLDLDAVTQGFEGPHAGEGTVTSVKVRVTCASSACKPELVSKSEKKRSLKSKSCASR